MSRSEGLNRAEELNRELEQPKTAERGTERPSTVAERINGRSAESQSADMAVRQVGCREALSCFGHQRARVQNRTAEPRRSAGEARTPRWPLSAEAAERCVSPRAGMAKRATDRAPERPKANAAEDEIARIGAVEGSDPRGSDPKVPIPRVSEPKRSEKRRPSR